MQQRGLEPEPEPEAAGGGATAMLRDHTDKPVSVDVAEAAGAIASLLLTCDTRLPAAQCAMEAGAASRGRCGHYASPRPVSHR
jgi:hypothetical protein